MVFFYVAWPYLSNISLVSVHRKFILIFIFLERHQMQFSIICLAYFSTNIDEAVVIPFIFDFILPKFKLFQIFFLFCAFLFYYQYFFFPAVVGFKCPTKVPSGTQSAKFWPFPRFPVPGDCHHLITCVEGQPRLIACGEGKVFDDQNLTCEDPELVPHCGHA